MDSLIILVVIIVISQIVKSVSKKQREAGRRRAVEEQRMLREEYEAARGGFSPPEDRNPLNKTSWEEALFPGLFREQTPPRDAAGKISPPKRFEDSSGRRGDSRRPQKKTPLAGTLLQEEKNIRSDYRSPASKNEPPVSLQTEKEETRLPEAGQWSRDQIVMGVIMSEVLGPPKARKGKQSFFRY